MTGDVLAVMAGAGMGLASALVPVLNAEAYLGVSGVARPSTVLAVAIALAAGQTVGKVTLYEAARHGSARSGRHVPRHRRTKRAVHVVARLTALLRRRSWGGVTVLASAAVGLPPLAAVSVLAGAARVPRLVFVGACLLGRGARFLAIALPFAVAT